MKENPTFEVLYWIGCAGSYDRRAQRVARAVVKLLNVAEVNFAILGSEEKCTGESARRLGDEFLFQELAAGEHRHPGQIQRAQNPGPLPALPERAGQGLPAVRRPLRGDPSHEFLAQLLREGRLKVPENGGSTPDSLTYHDPCYLARVNGIHDAPREVLSAVLHGSGPANSAKCRAAAEKTSCCGAGGGRMWMEEDPKQRVSTVRAREALATGAKTVAVGCPFCLTMMTDGVAANDRTDTRVLDVAEILVERLGIDGLIVHCLSGCVTMARAWSAEGSAR